MIILIFKTQIIILKLMTIYLWAMCVYLFLQEREERERTKSHENRLRVI